jgi:hypothetical protein
MKISRREFALAASAGAAAILLPASPARYAAPSGGVRHVHAEIGAAYRAGDAGNKIAAAPAEAASANSRRLIFIASMRLHS